MVFSRHPPHAYTAVRVSEDESLSATNATDAEADDEEERDKREDGSEEEEAAACGREGRHRLCPTSPRWCSSLLPLALLVVLTQLGLHFVHLALSPQPTSQQQPQCWLNGAATSSDSCSPPIVPWSCNDRAAEPLPTTPAVDSPFLAWSVAGASLSLQCPSGTLLRVRGLTWGHQCGWYPTTGLGSGCPWTSVVHDHLDPLRPLALSHSCRILHLTQGLQRLCGGRPSCVIAHAQLPNAPDVCPGRSKLLIAAWQCSAADGALRATSTGSRTLSDLTEVYEVQSAEMAARDSTSASSSPSPSSSASACPNVQRCELVISSQVNISGFGNWWAGGGLWNQLVNVQQMAALAWSAGCQLSLTAFLPDYNLATETRFGGVFDLDYINERLCAAHSDALAHPDTTFFKPIGSYAPALLLPPLQLSDTLVPGQWPGWEQTESTSTAIRLWMKSSIKRESSSLFYDALARELQRHPNPGAVWLRGGWDSWAGASDTLPSLQHLRSLFVDSLRPTPPFVRCVDALQRLMGVRGLGEFTFIHFRVESDVRIFADATTMSVDAYIDRMYQQLITAFDRMASVDHPQGSPEQEMGERIRAWPVYLGTGVLYSHRLVTRMREEHPWLRVFTKDLLLYDHCSLTPPNGAPASTSAEAQRALIAALQSIPWTAGVDECSWLSSEVTGDGRQTNREYWAIIDWQLAKQAAHFVGPTKSSFTVQTVEAIERHPRHFTYTDLAGHNRNATQFAWGLPVEF